MLTDLLDQPQTTRPGEELDAGKLEIWLRTARPDLNGPLEITQFRKGYSNLTYLLRVGASELVLRRPPFGAKIKTAHDMGREFRILSHLIAGYPKVPRPLAYCEDEAVLGAPFYLMERVRGHHPAHAAAGGTGVVTAPDAAHRREFHRQPGRHSRR